MLISENSMHDLIQVLLMENVLLKENDGTEEIFEIPKLPKGYWTLYDLLQRKGKVGEDKSIKNVKELIKFYGERFFYKGDKIDLSDLDDIGKNPKIFNEGVGMSHNLLSRYIRG